LARGVYARYARSGHLLIVTGDGKLVAYPFDAKRLEITGTPTVLYEGLEARAFWSPFALSNAGTIIYVTAGSSEHRDIASVTLDGTARTIDSAWTPQGTITNIALSPDGRQLAVDLRVGVKTDIWVKQLPSGPFSRATFGDSVFARPAWSRDG